MPPAGDKGLIEEHNHTLLMPHPNVLAILEHTLYIKLNLLPLLKYAIALLGFILRA